MGDNRISMKRSVEAVKRMSPEQRAEMLQAQRRSWAIGELMLENEGLSHDEAARRIDLALKEMGP